MVDHWTSRLDIWLQQNRPEFYQSLLPGLTPEEFAALEDHMGLTLPDDFRTLYSWRSGQSSNEFFCLEYATLMDAESIMSSWTLLQQVTADMSPDELPPHFLDRTDWWNPKWIPFLDWISGDVLCLDTYGSYGGKPGQMLSYVHDGDYRVVKYSGIEAWLRILVTVLEESSQTWDELMEDYFYLQGVVIVSDPGYPMFFPTNEPEGLLATDVRLYSPFANLVTADP